MDPEIRFFFYLAAVVCLVLAAFAPLARIGARTRRGATPVLTLLPLGVALFVFPFLWDAGVKAW
jgi:hypothetical protein